MTVADEMLIGKTLAVFQIEKTVALNTVKGIDFFSNTAVESGDEDT